MANAFKYTKAAIGLIIEDIKKIALILKYISLVFTTAYFIFVIVIGIGNLYVNIALASLFIIYSIFDLITYGNRRKHRKLRKHGRKIYRYIGLVIRAVGLGATLYGLVIATYNVSAFAIIATILSIIFWIMNIILEVIIILVERRISVLKDSISEDVETITAPVTKTKNFFRRIKGEEEITPSEKGKYFKKFKKEADEGNKEKDYVDQELPDENKEKPRKKLLGPKNKK